MRAFDVATIARFWSHVDKEPGQGPTGDCHEWTAARLKSHKGGGYGLFKFAGKMLRAHRVAFYLGHGHWPRNSCLHTCDNPPCVRLEHLFDGTAAQNTADMHAKGRANTARGARVAGAKLDAATVTAIRAATGSQRATAARFGVTQQTVSKIVRREIWDHV